MSPDPLTKTKADYSHIIERISVADSPVGIDATLTHAIIIDYLKQISDRLERIEQRLESQ